MRQKKDGKDFVLVELQSPSDPMDNQDCISTLMVLGLEVRGLSF